MIICRTLQSVWCLWVAWKTFVFLTYCQSNPEQETSGLINVKQNFLLYDYVWNWNYKFSVITVASDVLAPLGARPSAAAVMTAHLHMFSMMTSSNGNIFRVTGHLCGEFTGLRWIPAQKPVTRSFDVFFDLCLNKRLRKQSWGWWFETP